jgi:hypothetical protein
MKRLEYCRPARGHSAIVRLLLGSRRLLWRADWTGGSFNLHPVEDHLAILSVEGEAVVPLPFLRHDREPLLRLLLGGELAVVLEDDRGRVARFEGHLVGAFHNRDAVGDERMPQHVARPFHLEGAGECGDFAVQCRGPHHLALPLKRLDPRPQVGGDRDDAPGGGFRLACPQLDDAAVQVEGRPIEPVEFGHADAGERSDGKDRDQVGRGGVEQLLHLLGREDRHAFIVLDLHLFDLLRRRHLIGREAVLGAGEGEEHLHADQHAAAGLCREIEPAQPAVDVRGTHREDFAGEGGREAGQHRLEVRQVGLARPVLFFGEQ